MQMEAEARERQQQQKELERKQQQQQQQEQEQLDKMASARREEASLSTPPASKDTTVVGSSGSPRQHGSPVTPETAVQSASSPQVGPVCVCVCVFVCVLLCVYEC